MSNTVYYSDVKIMKKSFKQRIKSIFKYFLFFAIVVGCFFSAKYLSQALTVGNLGALIVFGDTKIKVNESYVYAVSLGEYSDKNEAERVALGSNIQGAGGFVWEDEGKYYVLGNVYSTLSDAEKVVGNLKDTKYSVSVIQITYPKLNLDFSSYENSDMLVINKSLEAFDDVYSKLYDYSIKFDKGDISNLAVSSGVSELRGEIKGLIISVQNLINKSGGSLEKVQNSLVKLDELLDQTIIKTIDNTSTNYSLKYSIVSVVRIKYDLFKALVW